MDSAAGEAHGAALRVVFDHRLKLEFHGPKVTSDSGLLAFRELDGCPATGTSGHRDPFRQETGLLVLFEGCRQGYSPSETQVDELPIWGMSANWEPSVEIVIGGDEHGSTLGSAAVS